MHGRRQGIPLNTPSKHKRISQEKLRFCYRGIDAVKVLMHLPKSFQEVGVKMRWFSPVITV